MPSSRRAACEPSLLCQALNGSIGFALASLQWRLEATELGHNPLGTPPRGQLLLRGPAIFKGYLEDKVLLLLLLLLLRLELVSLAAAPLSASGRRDVSALCEQLLVSTLRLGPCWHRGVLSELWLQERTAEVLDADGWFR